MREERAHGSVLVGTTIGVELQLVDLDRLFALANGGNIGVSRVNYDQT